MAECSPRLVLFDFFGTLVRFEPDRTRLRYERSHRVLVDEGASFDHEAFVARWDAASVAVERRGDDGLRECTMVDFVVEFERMTGLALAPAVRDHFIDVFLDEWSASVAPIGGVDQMLSELAGRHRLGVVSNTHDSQLVPTLIERFGIIDAFDVVVLSVDHGYRKPHPSIYQAALDHAACTPAETLFVGDTLEPDYLGPRRVGMPSLLIDPGRTHGQVPDGHRLTSVLDVPARIAVG
ncbi:MAG: HAD family hydrolase [Acidimicrobiales bacterium]